MKSNKNTITLYYEEQRSGGERCKGEKSGPYSCHEETFIDFQPIGLSQTDYLMGEEIEVRFDPKEHIGQLVYILIARYRDGDTFGSVSGQWKVIDAYLNLKDATKERSRLDSRGKSESYEYAWDGYFAQPQSFDIYSYTL